MDRKTSAFFSLSGQPGVCEQGAGRTERGSRSLHRRGTTEFFGALSFGALSFSALPSFRGLAGSVVLCAALGAAGCAAEGNVAGAPATGGAGGDGGEVAGSENASLPDGENAGGATVPAPLPDDEGEDTLIGDVTPPVGKSGIRPGDAVDILFVVDNSTSMGDKQAIFKAAIPDLIDQMVKPPCFNESTGEFVAFDDQGNCTGAGVSRVFEPVTDIHVAVISSSLGSHGLGPDQVEGKPICPDDVFEQNDRAHLIPSVRPEDGLDASNGGFLVWDSAGDADAAETDAKLAALATSFGGQVDAVREHGCGFEAPLEAAYRFLVEPEPYATIERGPCSDADTSNNCALPTGVDSELLAQREAFLRPDSHVVIVFLSDENDCSIIDRRQGYFAVRPTVMASGTAICDSTPNDPCCHSCVRQGVPEGCEPDPALNGCMDNGRDELEVAGISEAYNLRCFDHKRRFGVELLYPTSRYLDGFQGDDIINRDNNARIPNPLFQAGRIKQQVFVVGIVGTPWQDTVQDLNTPAGTLELKRATDVDWARLLPLPEMGNVEPLDPFNIETMDATRRAGKAHPDTGATIDGPGTWNEINGHDRELAAGDGVMDDLQYACIFELATPRDCAVEGVDPLTCDCTVAETDDGTIDQATGNPLCRDPESGQYGTTQYFAKAYPAPRMFEVLRGMGEQGVLSSICPRNATDQELQDYGYRPAIRALLLAVAPVEPTM